MGGKLHQSKKFKFNQHQNIGAPDAESDKNLEKVFVDSSAYEALRDINNSKCIIIGRTGSGKSALVKKLLADEGKIIQINPESMSIRYLSNSTILEYFRSLNINLNLFYKILWKHVFIIEILKLYVDDSEQKKLSFIEGLREQIKNRFGKIDLAKEKALEYLENWSKDEFWQTTEYRIKVLENTLEKNFTTEMGGDFKVAKFNSRDKEISSQRDVSEVKYKAEKSY